MNNHPEVARYIVVYETPRETRFHSQRTKRKAILIFDEEMELPFGFDPDTLGPDEDEVVGIVAVIDVSSVPEPRVVIDQVEYMFDTTGAPYVNELLED